MEKIKKDVEYQLGGTKDAICEALNFKKVQLYIAVMNLQLDYRRKFLNEIYEGKVSEETRRRFVKLKKALEKLESTPEIKTYLAMFPRHAELADTYSELSYIEASPGR